MSNHHPDDKREQQFPAEGSVPLLHGPLTDEEIRIRDELQRKEAEKAAEDVYRKRQIDLTESSLKLTATNIYLTWVLAIATVLGTGAAWYQARTARTSADAAQVAAKTAQDTLREMKTGQGQGALDTHTLAQQAVSQATQTTNLATAAHTQADELGKNVKEASRLATATEKANTHSIEFDRPWIGISIAVSSFEEGKASAITVSIINSGRRPAKVTLSEYGSAPYPAFPENPPYPITPSQISGSTTLLVPNLHTDTTMNISEKAVSPEYFVTTKPEP